MRFTILLFSILFSTVAFAQDISTNDYFNNSFRTLGRKNFTKNDSTKKWSLTPFAALSTSFIGFKGGSATVFSAPVGLQLTRKITDNYFAFGALSVAPSYINLRNNFINSDFGKTGSPAGFMRSNNFGITSRAEIGLGYTNDEKTFQISASIGVSAGNQPYFVPYSNNLNYNPAAFGRF